MSSGVLLQFFLVLNESEKRIIYGFCILLEKHIVFGDDIFCPLFFLERTSHKIVETVLLKTKNQSSEIRIFNIFVSSWIHELLGILLSLLSKESIHLSYLGFNTMLLRISYFDLIIKLL